MTIKPPPIQTPDPTPVINGGQEDGSGDTDISTPQGPQRRELVYNFVLLGKDVDSGNTDSIIVVSFDIPNRKVGMISIPRDTAVERTWRKIPKLTGLSTGQAGRIEGRDRAHLWHPH